MKICIEAQRLFREKKHGMEVVALETIRAIQQIDHQNEYHILAADDVDQSSLVSEKNIIVHRLPSQPYPLWEQWALPRYVNNIKPDVLHCTANTAPLWYKGRMMITIHDLIFMDSTDTKGSSRYQQFGNYYRRYIVPKVAKKATLLSTVSEFSAQEIKQRLGINENKIKVIPNGVSPLFQPTTDKEVLSAVQRQYHLPDDFFLHMANTAPRKNTVGVLKAYEKYCQLTPNPYRLVMLGCSKDQLNQWLDQSQISINREYIVLPGFVQSIHLPIVYALSSCFLYPSLQEGFGLPVIEAMACGVPVITSDNSSLKEVSDNAAILVNPTNYDQIANGMYTVTHDKSLATFLKSQGVLNAMRYSWQEAAAKTIACYNDLCGF